jgi:hypothetical protein
MAVAIVVPAARDTGAAPGRAMMGNSQMLDVLGAGMLREWLTHWTAQLPPLLAATLMLLAAGASARCAALIGTRRGRRPPTATSRGDRYTFRHLTDTL